MIKNNKPYSNRNNRTKNDRSKNTFTKNEVNNKQYDEEQLSNEKFEKTTRIRIDKERLNDYESLDTSFLEGRLDRKVKNNSRVKKKILIEKKENNIFNLLKKVFYILSVSCFLILITLLFLNSNLLDNKKKSKKEDERVVSFKKVTTEEEEKKDEKLIDDNYLFVGDFNTEKFDFSKFDLDYHYVKTSKDDYTTKDILDDMKKNIYEYNPSIIFIQLGINDLDDKKSKEDIIDNLEDIVKGIKENRPYAKIYIESLYPINKDIEDFDDDIIGDKVDNDDILSLNKMIKEATGKLKVNYVDMFKELSEDDKLKEDYTDNGIYLNKLGYEKILKVIKKIVDEEK